MGWLALLTSVASTSKVWLPYRHVVIDRLTGEETRRCAAACGEHVRYYPVTGVQLVGLGCAAALGAVTVGLLVGRLADRIASGPLRSRWQVLAAASGTALLVPALGILAAVLASDGRYDPVWNGGAEYAALGVIGVLLWLAVELYLSNGQSWTGPTGLEQRSPWTERRGPTSSD